ncbi:DUF1624 domain-containing protein [Methylomonas koyamae]|uniref:DUF1624 domain-containing protein n=1 Tax=Methylomonas koyamae TaxID=702114 RepID=UPI0006D01930|nr:heparan-alpha-glucosaminide N-acetyltransferase domain-containing protein [Methylomonas koyamae]BBL60521.1 hypothetical protein MKFW12EY_41340 [Methylomonas koyamae]
MSQRIACLDNLRGLVMMLMTLDHTRDYFSISHFDPTDLQKTTAALFLTRWITHFCAAVFVFLAGTSAYLWAAKRGTDAPVSGFLAKRGLLLLVLVCTVEAWAWNFRADLRHIDGGVLWALGWSMIVLAALVKLPLGWVVVIGGSMVVGHNLFDGLKPADLGWFGPWWSVLHTGDDIDLGAGWQLNPYYPLIPWVGVMALGYGFGHLLTVEQWRNPRWLMLLGCSLLAGFVALRYSNLYGDPQPWQAYPDPSFTLLSFLNCHKYPPSLLYLLMTLGPALVFLALAARPLPVLQVFGRTPLFYYLIHLYTIHGLAVLVALINGGPVAVVMGGGIWQKDWPADYGFGLVGVYGFWLLVLLMLYPVCRWFEAFKAARRQWCWLQYL